MKECFLTYQCLLSTTRSGCLMITLPPSTRGQDNPGFIQLTRPAISTHFNVANLILNTKRNLSQTWHAHEPKWELTVPFCQKSSQAAGQSHWHWKSLRRINIESTLGLNNGMKSMPGCQSRKARLLFSTWLSCNDSHPAVAHRHSINRLNSLIYNLQKAVKKRTKHMPAASPNDLRKVHPLSPYRRWFVDSHCIPWTGATVAKFHQCVASRGDDGWDASGWSKFWGSCMFSDHDLTWPTATWPKHS